MEKKFLTESANGGAGLRDDFSEYEAEAAKYYAQTYGTDRQKKNNTMDPNVSAT